MIVTRLLVVAALATTLSPTQTQAAMGLKCSDWLKVSASMRYDAQVQEFVPVPNAPRVRPEVDEKAAWVSWYIGGHVAALTFLDANLAKLGATVGVTVKRTNPHEMTLLYIKRIGELCRGGLEKDRQDNDVAEVIDLLSISVITLRADDITTMVEHGVEMGRRQGRQQR